jgi:hypothetical protein
MALIDIAAKSRDIFFLCTKECNDYYRSGEDLELYRSIITLHRETADIGELIERKGFINLIRRTLIAWNMDQRGAKLASEAELEKSILQTKPSLLRLYQYKLHELTEKTAEEIRFSLELVFGGLKVMKSKRRMVGVSKTLHFLLPDLVMPIDSTYTMQAIYGYNKYSDDLKKETDDFINIFNKTFKIAKDLNLTSDDITGDQWDTSVPKLIDNAIIGLFSFVKNEKVDELMQKLKSI